MAKPSVFPSLVTKIQRMVRKAELESKTGATGYTLLKFTNSPKPIARLIETKSIGPDELAAANDINLAFTSIASSLMLRAQTWERVDKDHDCPEPDTVIDAQRRYRNFAAHWSMRRAWGDRTLEIVIAVVIDERPFYLIDEELSLRHGRARKATIRGLRDYAVRAGWVRGMVGARWRAEAGLTFPQAIHPGLALAIARAKNVHI